MDGSPTFDGGYSPASLDGAAALISPDEAQEMDFCRSPRASFGSRRSSQSPTVLDDEDDAPRCVVLDFDGTLSTPKYVERLQNWAVCDKEVLISSLTDEEIWANGGGPARVDLLRQICLLYTSPSPRDKRQSRMPSSA